MSFRRFLWRVFKRGFHGMMGAFHVSELVLFVIAVALWFVWRSWEDLLHPIEAAVVVLLASLFVFGMLRAAYAVYREAESAEDARLRPGLEKFYDANRKARNQVAAKPGQYDLLQREMTLFVEADGGLRAIQKVRLRARQRLLMVEAKLDGESAVRSLFDLAFRVDGDAAHLAVWLPADETDTMKKMLIIFLPEVAAGDEVAYTYEYRWPGIWTKLIQGREDRWWHEVRSVAPVPLVRFRFKVARGVRPIQVVDAGGLQGQVTVHPVDADGYTDVVWERRNVPPDANIDLRLTS